jgi:hypothetical protein
MLVAGAIELSETMLEYNSIYQDNQILNNKSGTVQPSANGTMILGTLNVRTYSVVNTSIEK